MKAIETVYNGYRFRSRLEARWAVFFDTLGVKYEYEPEGYEFADGTWYLPDFWLPNEKWWIEIKSDSFTRLEMEKAKELARESCQHVLLVSGSPGLPKQRTKFSVYEEYNHELDEYEPRNDYDYSYEVFCFLGNLTDGVGNTGEYWLNSFSVLAEALRQDDFEVPVFNGDIDIAHEIIQMDIERCEENGISHPWQWGIRERNLGFDLYEYDDFDCSERKLILYSRNYVESFKHRSIRQAILAARSARFEFGESG